jgi:uncharacterized NAD(P)/FAD-binding protein YdhS
MSGKSTAKSFADILGTAKLPERSVEVCLRGDLQADLEVLERQLEEATEQQDAVNSLDAGAEIAEISEKIQDLRTEMKDHTYPFRVRALSRRAYRALVAAHPPRKVTDAEGNEKVDDTDSLGFNVETFFDALLRLALVDPEVDDATWSSLMDRLTDRQFEELAGAAWLLNRQEVDIPFSRAASRNSRSSAPA